MLPEEAELARLEETLSQLSDTVAETELEVETVRGNLARFKYRYLTTVGRLYAQMDELDAYIARLDAGERPDDIEAQARAAEAQKKAEESAREAGVVEDAAAPLPEPPKHPTPDVKMAFRKAARMIHPDLAVDEEEKIRRHSFMARLNLAYEQCDQAVIERILVEFGEDPDSIKGDDIGSRMVKAIRKIAQMRRRFADLKSELQTITEDEMYVLMLKVEESDQTGGDALADLEASLLQTISERLITVEMMKQRVAAV